MKPLYAVFGGVAIAAATAAGTVAYMRSGQQPKEQAAAPAAAAGSANFPGTAKGQQPSPVTGPSHISLLCDVAMTRYDGDGRSSGPEYGETTFRVDVANNKVTNMAGERMAARITDATIEYGGTGQEHTDISGRKITLTKRISGTFDRISGDLSETRSGQSQIEKEEPVSLGRVVTVGQCKPQAQKF